MTASLSIARTSECSKALSEEIRIRILMCLEGGPLGLQHFVDILEMAPSTLSKHLHILESAGLLVPIRKGRWRLYQWPDESADTPVGGLLHWLKQSVGPDPILETDAARRAVTVQNNPVQLPQGDVTRVLFLCTGNSCRSQMAEALLRARGGGRFEVASAGVTPRPIPLLTVEVMREVGIDIGHQQPKSVMEVIGKTHFDYLITVCAMAEEHTPVFPGVTHRLHWPMDDPSEAEGTKSRKRGVFRRVRDELDAAVSAWLDEQGH
jgi:thioredoxin type arsenate reductase